MWMWSVDNPRFIEAISPRLSQSAVCLHTRWLKFRHASWKSDPSVTTDASNATSDQPGVQRDCRSLRGYSRLVARSAISPSMTPPTCSGASVDGICKDIAVDLDYAPSLGPFREVLCVLAPILLVALLYIATANLHAGSWPANLVSAVLAAALASLARAVWLETAYKARERAFVALGDADSHFWPINTATAATDKSDLQSDTQLTLHVKVKVGDLTQPSPYDGTEGETTGLDMDTDGTVENGAAAGSRGAGSGNGVAAQGRDSVPAVHCYHGFGANLGSYKRVQEQLAAVLRGVVTAHDMPGFGLTQRPSDISSYFLAFNGRLGRLVLDYELQHLGLISPGVAGRRGGLSSTSTSNKVKNESSISSPLPASEAGDSAVSSAIPAPKAAELPGDGLSRALLMTVGSKEDRTAGLGDGEIKKQQVQPTVTQPRAIKRILVGHSMGGACASLEAVTNPDGLAGLVLVAPAVLALPGPEYQDVKLSPNRPDGTAAKAEGTTDVVAASAKAERYRIAVAHAAAVLGSEPCGSHVTDPPEVRRLYPVGQMPMQGCSVGGDSGSIGRGNVAKAGRKSGRRSIMNALMRAARSLLVVVASLALLTVLRILTPVITLLLRSLVRQRTFWLKGLQHAYYNPGAVTEDIVDSYRVPQLVNGWEIGLVRFLLARLTRPKSTLGDLLRKASKLLETTTTAAALATTAAAAAADAKRAGAAALKPSPAAIPPHSAAGPNEEEDTTATAAADPGGNGAAAQADGGGNNEEEEDEGDLATRLSALVASKGLPVLIIHGLYDKLVPASNSQRLARMLPGCELVLLDKCGHMPQEELPEIFVSLLAEFTARLPVCEGSDGPQDAQA